MPNFATFPDHPTFGPGGNGDWFRRDGMKSALQTPGWLASKGIDAFEYEAIINRYGIGWNDTP